MKRLALLFVVACQAEGAPSDTPAALPTVSATADMPPLRPPIKHDVGQLETTESGLQYIDLRIGDGPSPASPSSKVTVHYVGRLSDGTKFDSSYDRSQPFVARLTSVIKGWREGVMTMRVGGERRLIIPPELAYGDRNAGKIPAGSTLTFDIELLAVDDNP
jgi:peptidylprolyl isomerase